MQPHAWDVAEDECSVFAQARVENGQGEVMYDQRLFNQEAGMDSGLAADDAYNIYDSRLFADRGSNLYRHRQDRDDDQYGGRAGEEGARKFKPDKVCKGPLDQCLCGFSGVILTYCPVCLEGQQREPKLCLRNRALVVHRSSLDSIDCLRVSLRLMDANWRDANMYQVIFTG